MSDEFVQACFNYFVVLHFCNGISKVLFQGQQGMNSDDEPDDKQGHANCKEGIPIINPAYSGCTDKK